MTPPDAPPPTWFGLHERLRTKALERALEEAGLEEGTHFRWEKAPAREELAPLVAAHLARAFQQVTASLRDTPEGVKKCGVRSHGFSRRAARRWASHRR